MPDRQIIARTIALNQSCLSKEDQEEIFDFLFQYKGAVSLRDELGTNLKIEVHLQAVDTYSFYIRPFHDKEEGKPLNDKEIQRLII